MPHIARWLGLPLLTLALFLPVRGADDKKESAKPSAKPVPVKLSGATMTGQLSRRFYSREELKELEEIKKSFDKLKADADQADFERIQARAEAFGKRMERAFGLEVPNALLPLELRFVEELEVRVQQPPRQFDGKGKPVKPTPELLKKLKGPDPKKPGYTSSFEELREGQVVTVYFVVSDKTKAPAKAKPDPKAKGDAKNLPIPEALPLVGMVLIVQEASAK